jgi:hypothetical protein
MSEDEEKQRCKFREGLPESLRKIPLRYVDDVTGLSTESLRALDRAYRVEELDIPRALQYIRENLILSVEDLREFARLEEHGPETGEAETSEDTPSSQQKETPDFFPDERDIQSLARYLMECYPGMPEVSANAMAASDVMKEALKVVTSTREAIESDHARSDFVILSLFQLFTQSKKSVLEIIQGTPAFKKALDQSKVALD